MKMIILLPFPPDLPYLISEFPKYKADLQRWSRLSGFDPRVQGDIVLDNIGWDNPWKMKLENAVGEKVTNNKKGVSEILKFLEGCYELEQLRNMRWVGREMGDSILGFVNLWEARLQFVKGCGVAPYQVYGFDLLYGCNLLKTDRDMIKAELSKEGLSVASGCPIWEAVFGLAARTVDWVTLQHMAQPRGCTGPR